LPWLECGEKYLVGGLYGLRCLLPVPLLARPDVHSRGLKVHELLELHRNGIKIDYKHADRKAILTGVNLR
jgi:hypothetical protein